MKQALPAARAPAVVRVNGHSSEWLGRGFPWVYPNEVVEAPRHLRPGHVVTLRGPGDRLFGTGLWDDGWIAVRRMRSDEGPLDADWMGARLDAALARRNGHLPAETTAWRVIHGENDDLPGVRVDAWDRVLTVLLDSASLLPLMPLLVPLLEARLSPTAVYQGLRLDPREPPGRDVSEACRLVAGDEVAEPVQVRERGVRFLVHPERGMDAGLFPDMRDHRTWLDPWWPGASLLNLFAYTGAFSVFAARAGARRVVTADLARTAIQRARDNFALNALPPDDWEFVVEDAFATLDRLRRKGETFERVVVDAPSFSRAGQETFSVEKDTTRLVAASLRVLAPHGLLVIGNNQGSMSPRTLQDALRQGAWKAGRSLRLVHTGEAPVDFPASLDFPEGRYLKLWALLG